MPVNIIAENYISVRVAAERSKYTRAHIHNLANSGIIRSEMVTNNFRLVSWEDVAAYMEMRGRPVPEAVDV